MFINRDGQSQKQRFPGALDPQFAKIDDRSPEDLLKFVRDYAELIHYFDVPTDEINGTWKPFFDVDSERLRVLIEEKELGDIEPHLALYMAFLRLFEHARKQLNGLTGKHLNFYYKDVLKFQEKAPVPDNVHVLFELKKNVEKQLMKAGTLLKAGKDNKGMELFYALTQDILVNKASINSLRSVFVDAGNNSSVHIAPIANSSDGLGSELDEAEPKWQPFGNKDLPRAELGFALASPVLLLQEGVRTITVELTLSGLTTGAAFGNIFTIYLTGKEGWIGPKSVKPEVTPRFWNQYYLTYSVELSKEDEAIVHYDAKIHGSKFETSSPMMQVLLNKEEENNGYSYLKNAVLQHAKITVNVEGIQDLTLENDLGKLNSKKPFMPFGPNPVAGSSFYIGYEEALNKSLDNFSLDIEWQDVPAQNLATYYQEYDTTISANTYFTAQLWAKSETSQRVELFNSTNAQAPVRIPEASGALPVAPVSPLEYDISTLVQQSSLWAGGLLNQIQLTSGIGSVNILSALTQGPYTTGRGKPGFITLRLEKSFLHKEYRELYIKRIVESVKEGGPDLDLPNEPYTPVIQTLKLNYTAMDQTVNLAANNKNDFLSDTVEFFHITAFGQRREHGFQKRQLDFVADKKTYLLPQYKNEGEFYIGITDLQPLQNLAVLFQVAEGSANPTKKDIPVKWSILSDNHWESLDEVHVLSDTTNGLLTSGIITFAIPKEATETNTILPGGTYWLRAEVERDTDGVCQLLDVRSNAVLARFQDHNNDPEHLRKPLKDGTIKKLAERIAEIKRIEQPYASFGGRMAEETRSFHTRVSERLRHKHRAITIWDYERMILENFPSVYKVKCLNHTCPKSLLAPGHVTIIVIPDLNNKNAVNPLQPKVDLNTLDEIKTFLGKYTDFFVQLHVENPSYETIAVDCCVRFHKGFEVSYYEEMLNRELQQFLSPWAFEEGEDLTFGGQIHKSVLLNFIEKRSYVDYVTDFKMYHLAREQDLESAAPSSPKAVLVSSSEHTIAHI